MFLTHEIPSNSAARFSQFFSSLMALDWLLQLLVMRLLLTQISTRFCFCHYSLYTPLSLSLSLSLSLNLSFFLIGWSNSRPPPANSISQRRRGILWLHSGLCICLLFEPSSVIFKINRILFFWLCFGILLRVHWFTKCKTPLNVSVELNRTQNGGIIYCYFHHYKENIIFLSFCNSLLLENLPSPFCFVFHLTP